MSHTGKYGREQLLGNGIFRETWLAGPLASQRQELHYEGAVRPRACRLREEVQEPGARQLLGAGQV